MASLRRKNPQPEQAGWGSNKLTESILVVVHLAIADIGVIVVEPVVGYVWELVIGAHHDRNLISSSQFRRNIKRSCYIAAISCFESTSLIVGNPYS